jgi:hypothetical protein
MEQGYTAQTWLSMSIHLRYCYMEWRAERPVLPFVKHTPCPLSIDYYRPTSQLIVLSFPQSMYQYLFILYFDVAFHMDSLKKPSEDGQIGC